MLEIAFKVRTLCFPPRCAGCRAEIQPIQCRGNHPSTTNEHHQLESLLRGHWCDACLQNLLHHNAMTCWTCGAQLNQQSPLELRCALCFKKNYRFTRAISIGNYHGLLQKLVIRMKNQHDEPLTIQLGNLLANQIIDSELCDSVDLITAVPTHWWRRFKRGFQAAEMIADTVAHAVDHQFDPDIIKCQRSTQKQGTLASTSRQKNVQNAFSVNSSASLPGLRILLIDDVMTSGATVNEISRVLLSSGAEKVYVGVIARGARVS